MDNLAIDLVNVWNSLSAVVAADSLRMSPTPRNGYTLAFISFALLSGGGFFVLFGNSDD
jgi:hypothetical protein